MNDLYNDKLFCIQYFYKTPHSYIILWFVLLQK